MGAALANKNKTLGQVQKYIAREQYDRAIKLLQQLVEDDPNDVRSLLKLGDVYVKKGDRDVAVDVYKRVARQYSEQGFFMKAVAIYKQILKHQSKNVEALMQLAELYEHLGLASEARQQYLLAESVLQESGDSSAALSLMQKQVELDPDNVAHRIKLAEAYSSQDNVAAATRQFAAAAEVLRRQNREEDFIKVAERLVYHDPNRPEILRDLARLYLSRGDAKRALAKLQLCFRSQPKDIETLELLAQAFSELRQYARTKTVYQELVQVLEDKGLVGKAEEYRLLIRQLEEADRPTPASPSASVLSAFSDPAARPDEIVAPLVEGPGSVSHAMGAAPPAALLPGAPLAASSLSSSASPASSSPRLDQVAAPSSAGPYPASLVPFGGPAAPQSDLGPFARQDSGADQSEPESDPFHSSFDAVASGPVDLGQESPEGGPRFDDVIIEAPVEVPAELTTDNPPPPPAPETTTVEQQIESLLRDAKVYLRYNLPAGALEQLQHALELDPDNIEVLTQMRDLFVADGSPARAAEIVAEMARVHFRNGDRDAAEAAKKEIAQLAPSHPLAVDALADSLPAIGGTGDQREDSLSFVITEDSGSFEIVDVADSGSVPDLPVMETNGHLPHLPEDELPNPEFATASLEPIEDDEPLHAFTSDLLNESLVDAAGTAHDAKLNGPIPAPVDAPFNGVAHAPAPAKAPAGEDENDGYEHVETLAVEHEELTASGNARYFTTNDDFSGDDLDTIAAALSKKNGHTNGFELAEPVAAAPASPEATSAAAELGSHVAVPEEAAPDEPEPETTQERNPMSLDEVRALPDLTDELAEVQFFLDVGDEDGAQDVLRELVQQYPNHPEVMAFAMALDVETIRGQRAPTNRVTSEDVQAAFDKALEPETFNDDPSEVQDAYDQGMALMEIDRTAQAIEAFERAAEWPSMAATAREMLVRCYAKMDQPTQAVAHFRDAEAHGVQGAAATHLKYLIASCYERTSDLTHALEWYESCAADDPTHLDVQEQVKRVSAQVYGAARSDDVVSAKRPDKISYL